MRSILAGDETVGTKIRAGTPRCLAAYATAAPWLPPEAATTPAAGIARVSRCANAPRVLNEPACCRCSSLNVNETDCRSKSAPSMSIGYLSAGHQREADHQRGNHQRGDEGVWSRHRKWQASVERVHAAASGV